jgi:hypothetical protein
VVTPGHWAPVAIGSEPDGLKTLWASSSLGNVIHDGQFYPFEPAGLKALGRRCDQALDSAVTWRHYL